MKLFRLSMAVMLTGWIPVAHLCAQTDSTPTPQWRPVYHFTPEKNWTNDPNGPIFLNGRYQLYNQQNPLGNKWGHMSWGHATSTDLVHWKHLPVAMPETIDQDTNWRFSGSAVNDKNNTSGFCHTPDCLVAIYTLHQPNLKKESQAIAYSDDGGMNFTNYNGNPVIDLHKKDFRDPSVSWNDQLKKWSMVVVLPSEYKALFYASTDLKKWDSLGEFANAGYRGSNWECPSLIRLPVEGKPGLFKWVLFISTAGPKNGFYMQYFIGEFDGRHFTNDNSPDTILTVDHGDSYYAAIPWNSQPDGKEIMIGWLAPGNSQSTFPWRGQMSIPRDLTLRETINGYNLIQLPSSVIEQVLVKLSDRKKSTKNNLTINAAENQVADVPGNAYWLDAKIRFSKDADFQFKIGQEKNNKGEMITETIVGYDARLRQC
jgi:fructan beta-fructosidase